MIERGEGHRLGSGIAAFIIVAAGKGERFGDAAKVLVPIGHRTALAWSLDAAEQASSIRDIVIVAGDHTAETIRAVVVAGSWSKVRQVVIGGTTRQDSVAAGIGAVAPDIDVLLVHDAARPFVTSQVIDACALATQSAGAACVAVPLVDTIKRVGADGTVIQTLDRSGLWAAQTPQGLHRRVWMRVMEACSGPDCRTFTDEVSACEHIGVPVRIIEGERTNIKITVPADLELATAIAHGRLPAHAGTMG